MVNKVVQDAMRALIVKFAYVGTIVIGRSRSQKFYSRDCDSGISNSV